MKMVEVKTAELIGPALDWAVAQAAGWAVEIKPHGEYSNASTGHKLKGRSYRLWMVSDVETEECAPSTDWSQGGPLIARYNIDLNHMGAKGDSIEACLNDFDLMRGWVIEGETHLVAACRAIVAAKLGDVVSVPAELVKRPA